MLKCLNFSSFVVSITDASSTTIGVIMSQTHNKYTGQEYSHIRKQK